MAKNSKARRRVLHREQDGKCFWCGVDSPIPRHKGPKVNTSLRFTTDHVIPKSRGGPNIKANVVGACNHCNLFRNAIETKLLARKKPKYVVPAKYLPVGFLKF